MAGLDSIQALLQALKQREAGGPSDDEDTANASASMVGDDTEDSADPDDNPDSTNDKIVGVLKNAYPKIYAKILGQLTKDDSEEPDDQGGDATMIMPAMPPPSPLGA